MLCHKTILPIRLCSKAPLSGLPPLKNLVLYAKLCGNLSSTISATKGLIHSIQISIRRKLNTFRRYVMIGINKQDLFKLFYCMETQKLIKRGPESTSVGADYFDQQLFFFFQQKQCLRNKTADYLFDRNESYMIFGSFGVGLSRSHSILES